MDFTRHTKLIGMHSFLSPSKYAWLRYDEDKLDRVFHSHMDAARGTELHELAARLIKLGVKLPDVQRTLNMYVNDAIGFKMSPEVTLFYSENCFGTADAIGYRQNTLRIHDLKNGVNAGSMDQLMIYAAIFCHEYRMSPNEIQIELRIYQNDGCDILVPDPMDVIMVMEKIKSFDQRIAFLKSEVP